MASQGPRICVGGNEIFASFRHFNANHFPDRLQRQVESAGNLYALLLYYRKILEPQLKKDVKAFLVDLNTQFVGVKFNARFESCQAEYNSVAHMASLHGMLFNLKAFLDSLATLWGPLVDERYNVKLFSKKLVEGEKLSGGVLIHWLRRSVPRSSTKALPLAAVVENHSRSWISEAVTYRDELIHYGGIPGLKGLRLQLADARSEFSENDLLNPELPDGRCISTYCHGLVTNCDRFVEEAHNILLDKS